jgi:EAL and modified HD-GYP domain-containing signal transduction protein
MSTVGFHKPQVPAERLPTSTRFLGRQAIYDRQLNLFGYELLFRSSETNSFAGDGDEATRQVVDNCLLFMPEREQGLSFVNCTRKALLSGIVTLLPAANTVLEILEDVSPDPDLVTCCQSLKQHGYRFALDDFSPECAHAEFLELADFVKVDFRVADASRRREIYALIDPDQHQLIAEKVETREEVDVAAAEGCELFQGYFLSRPRVASMKTIPQQQIVYLRLLSLLSRLMPEMGEIEKLIKSDTSICFRLLRLVNSALFHLPSPITSIRTAMMMVGLDELRKLVLVSMVNTSAGGSAKALVVLALERAKFCEHLAPFLRLDRSTLYLLGMLSLLDVMLDTRMDQVLTALPLDPEMKDALLGKPNAMRVALDLVRAREQGEWRMAADQGNTHGISEEIACTLHLRSALWADQLCQQM